VRERCATGGCSCGWARGRVHVACWLEGCSRALLLGTLNHQLVQQCGMLMSSKLVNGVMGMVCTFHDAVSASRDCIWRSGVIGVDFDAVVQQFWSRSMSGSSQGWT
jgi:hypothetical protein